MEADLTQLPGEAADKQPMTMIHYIWKGMGNLILAAAILAASLLSGCAGEDYTPVYFEPDAEEEAPDASSGAAADSSSLRPTTTPRVRSRSFASLR